MKNLFCNLKPFLSYWGSFAVYFAVSLFELTADSALWKILYLALICIFNFITGYTDGVKGDKVGISLFSIQLIIFAIFSVCKFSKSRIVVFGNLILSIVFDYTGNTIIDYVFAILSVALPIIPFFIGNYLKSRNFQVNT